ncbi:amino acid adenylation domain-containing protein [Myxococcus sp. CA056]|uniref:non-ribosomal peptide synthetase/type I polyketide synthase n=1 Tax=Myxococcus sp. CA056 TaxID=2741740 RepID=UPI00157B00CA|nr:non-ribosomal peptide synthetase/type I polyketide synthase [Myxococcus sp. CA056]NTX13823.1 amino acid adenylation domain-containing protein [Myxococcus sp. CA056]
MSDDMERSEPSPEGVAIIAMSGRFPQAATLEQFWDNLRRGVEARTVFTDEELLADGADPARIHQPGYVRAGFVLEDVDRFDAGFFDFSPRDAEVLDPQHRVFLECCWEALERAGYASRAYRGQISVFGGAGASSYLYSNLLSRPDVLQGMGTFQVTISNDKDFLPPRISHKLGLRGASIAVQTACSSSLVAIHLACQSLLTGESDLALAGGVSIALPQRTGYAYQEGGVVSPDAHCRTFDAKAAGTVRGSGAGVVVLKRLADALADGNPILAVIRGSAVNNDGEARLGYTAPSIEGQTAVVSEALGIAGVPSESVTYVEAHGTATPLGDPIEVTALTKAFRARLSQGARARCALGSVKTNIGHLDAAAGVAGLIKTVLALQHRELPPCLHFEQPNPKLDLASGPFFVNDTLRPWESDGTPRRAGVSSFGIGGTNAHVILEEAPARPSSTSSSRPWQLLTLSARTVPALEAATSNLQTWLTQHPEAEFAQVAHTLQVGRQRFSHRRVLVCRDAEDARASLEARDPQRLRTTLQEDSTSPVVFLFPGQGAQYVGMGQELHASEPVFRKHVDDCCTRLKSLLGFDLREVLFPPSDVDPSAAEARLTQTAVTQPALFVIEYALAKLWMSLGVTPQAMLGHSIGEYVAACIAGVLTLDDALALVTARGQLMQSLPSGAMLSVALPEAELRPLLGPALSLAAVNGPALCVASGPTEMVEALEAVLTRRKVEFRRLHTSHAFHSAMMDPILEAFAAKVRGVRLSRPRRPYVSNLTGTWITEKEATDPGYWVEHLRQAVRFADGAKLLLEDTANVFLEVGPGTTLGALVRQAARSSGPSTILSTLRHPRESVSDRTRVLEAVGQLWLAGAALDLNGLQPVEHRRRLPLPTYPFQRDRYWIEPRAGAGLTQARAVTGPGLVRKQGSLADWFYVPGWKHAVRPGPSTAATRWLVMLDERLGPALADRLEATGGDVVRVATTDAYGRQGPRRFTVAEGQPEGYTRLLAELDADGWKPERVVHLGSVAGASLDEASTVDRAVNGFHDLLHLASALHTRKAGAAVELIVVTAGAQDVTGEESLCPASALLVGACKVLPQELSPALHVRTIDVAPAEVGGERLTRLLVDELRVETAEPVIAYRGGRRWAETYERARPPEGGQGRLRERGVYLITGGLGRIGLTLAEELATSFQARLVFVGRSAFPAREAWEAWLASHGSNDETSRRIRQLLVIEQRGGEVLVLRADISRPEEVAEVLARTEARFGALHGVIHSAGSLGERAHVPVLDPGDARHAEQFDAKVRGVLALERALRGRALDFVLLQSSLAAVLGGIGFAAYAAANLFMDAFAARQNRSDSTPWLSVDWDGWGDEETLDEGMLALTMAEGVAAFRSVLRGDVPRWVVSTGDLSARLATWVQPVAARGDAASAVSSHARPQLATGYMAPRDALEQELAAMWQELLGVTPVGRHDSFFDLGGHSLLGTQLLSRLRETYRVELPIRTLFETPTVAGLAEAITQSRSGPETRPDPAPTTASTTPSRAPLSFAQQRLWFWERLEPGTSVYNIHTALQCDGDLDVGALGRSLDALAARHEALRTTFVEEGDQVVQVIARRLDLEVPVTDLRDRSDDTRADEARRVAEEEGRRPFDLEKGPLLRARLIKLAAREHVVTLTVHHSIFDAWSLGLLIRELAELYTAFAAGRRPRLPELTMQYADFARWQRERLQGDVLEAELAHWRTRLAGAPPALELPTDRPRPATPSYDGASHPLDLPRELTDGLKELGRREGATLFMVLLAGFQAVLARHSGQDDIVVGTPIAGRNRVELESIVGFFINTLALRTRLSGNPTFRELVGRVREVTLAAYAHQDIPFDKLVEALAPPRDRSRSPLFQVLLILQNAPVPELALPGGLKLRPVGAPEEPARFDLSLSFTETASGLQGTLRYATALFDANTARRLLGHLRMFLEAVAANPDQRLDTVSLLSADEQRELAHLESGRRERPSPRSILERFRAWVDHTPAAPAALMGERTVRYDALALRAHVVARELARHGVRRGTPVAVFLPRSPELLATLLGVLEAGGAYVPLDPGYPAERVAYMLGDARPRVVVTDGPRREQLPEAWREGAVLVESLTDSPGASPRPADLQGDDVSHLVYTSGSTGMPKGIIGHHAGILNYVDYLERTYRPGPGDVALQLASASFDASLRDMLAPVLMGTPVVFADGDRGRDPEELLAAIERYRVTLLPSVVPSLLRLLLAAAGTRPRELGTVRLILCSGERLLATDVERARAVFGAHVRIVNQYGPTECTLTSTFHIATPQDLVGVVPAGRPIDNAEVVLLDARGERVPAGVVGHIHIGGNGVTHGFLGRPDLTAERFVPHPDGNRPGARLYATGDYGRWRADGALEFVGRRDDQVKVRGNRVELGEIESNLTRCPGVGAAVVLAVPEQDGETRLVACIVASDAGAPSDTELTTFLAARLPEPMLPSAYLLLDVLPRTPNGKADRAALMPAATAARRRGGANSGAPSVTPRTPTQEIVAGLWAQLLSVERVGIHDSFFDLGGHSLLATQAVSRVRVALGVEVPLRELFTHPTVEALSARIDELAMSRQSARGRPPLVPAPRTQGLPLSFAQKRLWVVDRLRPGDPAYNISGAIRVRGALDAEVLERCVAEIVRRHESLRTTFEFVGEEPVQRIAAELEVPLGRVDLSDFPEPEREDLVARLVAKETGWSFALAQGPLLRLSLLRLSEAEHVLVFAMHHIISDGWSRGILVRDLMALYVAFVADQPSPLPKPVLQYADFAHWQRSWLRDEVLEAQLAYWRRRLAGVPPVLALPTDRPRPVAQSLRGAHYRATLPPPLVEALKRLGRTEGVTLFMTLMAGFQALLSRYTGQEDLTVGTDVAGRNNADLEGLIGFFVNQLVIRGQLDGNPPFRALLTRVRDTALEAYANQDLPFEELVRAVNPERSLGHTPLFQVKLALQNQPFTELQLPGLSLSGVAFENASSKFDLTLVLEEFEGSLVGLWEFSTDLFDEATIARMAAAYQRVLEAVVTAPDLRLSALPVLADEERHRLLVEWNATDAELPEDRCAHHLFEEQARRTPEAPAVSFQGRALSYAELDQRANQLAHHLRGLGVGPELRVGVCLERSLELVVALLGVLKAGGSFVPLDPGYPTERLSLLLRESAVSVLLTQDAVLDELPLRSELPVCLDSDWTDIARHPTSAPSVDVTPENLAYVIFTSGSTGQPKGVLLAHRGLCNTALAQVAAFDIAPGSRVLQAAALGFDASVSEVFATLLGGGCLHLPLRNELMPGAPLRDLIQREAITTVTLTPPVLAQLEPRALDTLRVVISAGDACTPELAARWKPGRRFLNAYGPTEVTVCASISPDVKVERPSIGRPLPNVRLYVLDPHLQPVPLGSTGELYVGGVGLARGYLERPDLTAERFIPSPFALTPGERLYRTGDLVRALPSGEFEFSGRVDNQVKVRGFRVELGEVEAVLGQAPGVHEAVVVARADAAGGKRLVAYFVAREDTRLAVEDLRAFLRERLPDYMVPSAWVLLMALPLTPHGKVDAKALPAPEAAPGTDDTRQRTPPRTPTEELIAEVWADVLQCGSVGVDDDFFELGGHSLMATQVTTRVGGVFGLELSLTDFFSKPTVAALATHIDSLGGTSGPRVPPVVATPPCEVLPLSPRQQVYWSDEEKGPEDLANSSPAAFRLDGPLDTEALREGFDLLVRRHEILRTSFPFIDGTPMQRIASQGEARLQVVELGDLPEQQRQAELMRRIDEAQHRSFDVAQGPLLRAWVFRLTADTHVLLLNQHHAITDYVSTSLFMGELAEVYAALREGLPPRLPEPALQYRDVTRWEHDWLRGGALEQLRAYWSLKLASPVLEVALPYRRPRQRHEGIVSSLQPFHLSPELSRATRALCRKEGVTPFVLMLAAFQVVLSRCARQEDIAVGFSHANRQRMELEKVLGMFAGYMVLRTDLSGDPSFLEVLRRARSTYLEAFQHQGLPHTELVKLMPPPWQVGFSFTRVDRAQATSVAGLSVSPLPLHRTRSLTDLKLNVVEAPEGLGGTFEYKADLFEHESIQAMQDDFQALLEFIVAAPDQRLSELPRRTHALGLAHGRHETA